MASKVPVPRVVIAGGSISGLITALALEKAGIEFLVLERGEIAPQIGASTGFFPHGQRILDQLGVFQDIVKCTVTMERAKAFNSNGDCVDGNIGVLAKARARYGYPVLFSQRQHFLQAIYNQIQHKEHILTKKKVVGFSQNDEKVTVTTEDRCCYEGTILVGADGIHSGIRRILASQCNNDIPGSGLRLETTNGGQPGFCTEYRCLFAVSKVGGKCPVPPGHCFWTYGKGFSTTTASGEPDHFFWFLFTKVDKTQDIVSPRYTEEDAEALIDQYRDLKMTDQFTVGDAWANRVRGNLLAQEEGILDQWSHGRVVLVGDAIHKMSVNAGLGAMTAMEGIVHLVNLLYPVLSPRSATHSELTNDLCDEIFHQYRERHMQRLPTITTVSAQTTRLEAQANWLYWLASLFVLPWLGDGVKMYRLRNVFGGAPVFDFLDKDKSKIPVSLG